MSVILRLVATTGSQVTDISQRDGSSRHDPCSLGVGFRHECNSYSPPPPDEEVEESRSLEYATIKHNDIVLNDRHGDEAALVKISRNRNKDERERF